jgi:hypothetical protein
MLTELALLPSVFDADVNATDSEWRELLRACIQFLRLPSLAASVVVSDLYDGSWRYEVERIVNGIPEQRTRQLCKDLFRAVEKLLVRRPCNLSSYPTDEMEWAKEAFLSHAVSPIDRIVAAAGACVKAKGVCPSIQALRDVENASFWHGAFGARSLPLDIQQQVRCVSKVILHSDWIALTGPHALTGDGSFAEVLFREACALRSTFGPVRLEVHTKVLDTGPEGQKSTTDYLSSRFKRFARHGDSVEVYYWPSMLERRLFGGTYTQREGGDRKKKRWCVSMTHSALPSDRRDEDVTFAIVTDGERPTDDGRGRSAFDLFVSENSADKPRPYRLV